MGGKATKNEGKYLYAVIPAAGDREYGNIGIDGESVYLIADNQVAAVVSNFSNGKIRPERRHIAAHQAVLKRLMEEETPLPITFGVIAEGAKGDQTNPVAQPKILCRTASPRSWQGGDGIAGRMGCAEYFRVFC